MNILVEHNITIGLRVSATLNSIMRMDDDHVRYHAIYPKRAEDIFTT